MLQLAATLLPQQRQASCLTVNIARGKDIRAIEMARELRNLLSSRQSIRCRGIQRRGDPGNWRADVSRLRSLLPNWRPSPLSTALADCVRTWEKQVVRGMPR